MLPALALALALTSPVPLPRPAPVPAAEPAQPLAMVAPSTTPAWPVGRVAAGAPVPRPLRRPAEAAQAEAPPPAAASEPGGAGEDRVGDGAGASIPVPPERPAAAVPGAMAREEAGEADEHGPPAEEAPKPVARPTRGPAGEAAGGAPVVKAMLAPGQALPPEFGRPTAPRDMVCRDPRIVGAPAASFVGNIPGCGIFEPVRVASISGVRMSAPITVDCRTARAFADWLGGVVQPAARETLNGSVESLWVMGSYSCRTRNNQPGKRLSEHSAGRAIDVGGMTLKNGRRIVVRDDWGAGEAGAFLARIREAACGGFTTVLGPGSDSHHYNHFHLDTAYRSSTYCR